MVTENSDRRGVGATSSGDFITIAMLELNAVFIHANGSSQIITIRIGDVSETHGGTANPWSAAVEILGFANPATYRIRGRDWAEAIEDAARFAAMRVADMVEAAGGGTLDPPLLPRLRLPTSGSAACRIADDEADEGET